MVRRFGGAAVGRYGGTVVQRLAVGGRRSGVPAQSDSLTVRGYGRPAIRRSARSGDQPTDLAVRRLDVFLRSCGLVVGQSISWDWRSGVLAV